MGNEGKVRFYLGGTTSLSHFFGRDHERKIPEEAFQSHVQACEEQFPNDRNGDLYFIVSGKQVTLTCGDYNFGSQKVEREASLSTFAVSDNLANRLKKSSGIRTGSAISAHVLMGMPSVDTKLARAVLAYPEGLKIAAKVEKGEPINWQEIDTLMALADAGEPAFANVLQKNSLSKLLGTKTIKTLRPQDMAPIRRIFQNLPKNWARETPSFVIQIYRLALAQIPENRETEKTAGPKTVEMWHDTVGEFGQHLYEIAKKTDNKQVVDFFLKEICQKPNPDTVKTVKKMIDEYSSLPPLFRFVSDPFLKNEFDLAVAENNYQTFFNDCPVYADLLAFLYRKGGRTDARQALEDLMLQEITQGEQYALNLYLKEIVETDRDPAAILRLKMILLEKLQLAYTKEPMAPHVLFGILRRDESFHIFEPFLNGKEAITVSEGPPPIRKKFDMTVFARDKITPAGPFCVDVMRQLLERKFFAAVQTHLSAHYTDTDPEFDGSDDWLYSILIEASLYPPMHAFLKSYVDDGNPHLGFVILKTTARGEMDPLFLNKIKECRLDAIQKRMEALVEQDTKGDIWGIDRNLLGLLDITFRALDNGFTRVEEFVESGFFNTDLKYRRLYVSHFSRRLAKPHRTDDNKITPTPTPLPGVLLRLRDRLTRIDLSYVSDYADQIATQETARSGMASLAFDVYSIVDIWSDHFQNPTVLDSLEGFYRFLEASHPQQCEPDSSETKDQLEEIVEGIVSNRLFKNYQERSETPEGIAHLRDLTAFAEKHAGDNSIMGVNSVFLLRALVLEGPLQEEALNALFRVAEPTATNRAAAIDELDDLYQYGGLKPHQQDRIDRFFKNYDPEVLLDRNCYGASQTVRREALAALLKHGNTRVYDAWRNFILDGFENLTQRLANASSIKDLDDKDTQGIINDLLELGNVAAKDHDGNLSRRLAKDVTDIYNRSGDLIGWVFEKLGGLQDDPLMQGAATLMGGSLTEWGAYQGLVSMAEKNGDAYAWLSVLAQGDIPSISDKARRTMMGMNHEGENRGQIYAAFRANQRKWIYEFGSRRRTGENRAPF